MLCFVFFIFFIETRANHVSGSRVPAHVHASVRVWKRQTPAGEGNGVRTGNPRLTTVRATSARLARFGAVGESRLEGSASQRRVRSRRSRPAGADCRPGRRRGGRRRRRPARAPRRSRRRRAGRPSSRRDRPTVSVPAPPAQSGTDIHRSSDSVFGSTDDQ